MAVLIAIIASIIVLIVSAIYFIGFARRGRVPVPDTSDEKATPDSRRRGRALRLRRRQPQGNQPAEEQQGDHVHAQEASTSGKKGSKKKAKKRNDRGQVGDTAGPSAPEEEEYDGVNDVQDGVDAAEEEVDEELLGLSAYEIARRQKAREREEEELALEEEIRIAQAEREAKELSEFQSWKGMFSVETSGEDKAPEEEARHLRESLCNYIKQHKMVQLEDVSSEFNTRTRDVVLHIEALEAQGALTGIMDDRGKYIYLSEEEMSAVVQHIRGKGRITISELAKDASKLMKLEGSVQAREAKAGETQHVDLDALIAED